MDLSFFPLTLEAIDQAAAESLCLFIASDERPLTGLAGLADWRLSGKLSRLLRSGLLTGEAGEAVLTPPGARLAFQKLFLFGVGPSDQADQQLVARVAEALRKLAQAGVREAALQLPARLSVEAGIRALIDELNGPGRALVFGPEPQKLVTALSQAASRGSQPPPERRVVKVPTPSSPVAKVPATPEPAPQRPPPLAGPALPKASPLPFAPQGDLPAPDLTPPPPPPIPKASPLPFAPIAPVVETTPPPPRAEAVPAAEALPTGPAAAPVAEPAPAGAAPAAAPDAPAPAAPAPAAEAAPPATPAADKPAEERRPAPPPPQRYVPPPPKPHVFEKKRKKR